MGTTRTPLQRHVAGCGSCAAPERPCVQIPQSLPPGAGEQERGAAPAVTHPAARTTVVQRRPGDSAALAWARPPDSGAQHDPGLRESSQEGRRRGPTGGPSGSTRRSGLANRKTEDERARCSSSPGVAAAPQAQQALEARAIQRRRRPVYQLQPPRQACGGRAPHGSSRRSSPQCRTAAGCGCWPSCRDQGAQFIRERVDAGRVEA
jgi:hypothetical protein